MTEPQNTGNTNERDPLLAEPAAEPDWNAIANQLAAALRDAGQDIARAFVETEKQRYKRDFIDIAGIVISALTLLFTVTVATIGAVYLTRQQELTKIQLSLAHITLDATPDKNCVRKMDCLTVFQVTNNGPASAAKVTVDVILHSVSDQWKASINDMGVFKVFTSPPAVSVSTTLKNINDPSALNTVKKYNEYEITINSLPPGRSVQVDFSSALPVTPQSLSMNTTLYIVSQAFQRFNFGNNFPIISVIQKYFDKLFSIGELEVNASCDNCANNPEQTVNTSSLETNLLQTAMSPQDPLDSTWKGSLNVTFERPKNAKPLHIDTSLNLWTQPDNPTTPIDISTQSYLGIVTLCALTGQTGGQEACQPVLGTGS